MTPIHSLKIVKNVYSEKQHWVKVNDKLNPVEFMLWDDCETETLYFATYKEVSEHINSLTKGFVQYWVDVQVDDTEILEYHNGLEWDIEYTFTTGRIDLPENVVEHIVKEYLSTENISITTDKGGLM